MPELLTEQVDVAQWRARVAAAHADGFTFLRSFTAIDEVGRDDVIRVLLVLDDIAGSRRLQLETSAGRAQPVVPGIGDVFAGAVWLQRQIHDFFGVEFDGDDNRPLLNHQGGAPLLKDRLLEPRIENRWPGAAEPGEDDASPGRRKLVPPGVPEQGLMADPDATPADIALSASGTRVRRGR